MRKVQVNMDVNTELAIDAFRRLARAERRVERLTEELEMALRHPIDLAAYAKATDSESVKS